MPDRPALALLIDAFAFLTSTSNDEFELLQPPLFLSVQLYPPESELQAGVYNSRCPGTESGNSDKAKGEHAVKQIQLFMLTALSFLTLMGQEAKKVQEPEYNGVVFYLDPAGALTPLERQQSNLTAKNKALGFGGAQASFTYKGSRSPVRFKAAQEIQFVVRTTAPAGTDPASVVNLDVLKVSKNERSIIALKMGALGGTQRNEETLQPLNFSKYGEQSLKVSPAEPLKPGEYVIKSFQSGFQVGFLFGIDPK